MPPPGPPKFKRRKADRPDEIVAAAFTVFAERGYASARLEDIAARAGVSKGAVYLYFTTKEEIFQAVIEQAVAPNLDKIRAAMADHPKSFSDRLAAAIAVIAPLVETSPLGGVLKMVIGESRNFPHLARAWHDALVAPALAALSAAIAEAQLSGELRPCDPRQAAIGLMSPILLGVIWRETFVPVGAAALDIPALARQHVETWSAGMSLKAAP